MSNARPPNRLAREASPYLRQHAHNPVDWWPWCAAAFAEARRRDVPIFLSIGYSTCYWCHVMERESFESDAIADPLNRAFVCIKVDREERPDVDDIYMAAVQAFTGRGGWPMSVFLEPVGLRPFWAGTYLPPDERPGMGVPGFPRVIDALSNAWRDRRAEVLEQAQQLAESAAERVVDQPAPVRPGVPHVQRAVVDLLRLHDRRFGGFGPAPKFPQPVFLELLLDVRDAVDDATRAAIDAACRGTFDAMALGGLFDQIGGGFHRYSVDATWTVPHFEKMLYDNAQLAHAYARAWRAYADPLYRRTAERTLLYIERELTDPSGAFWSAQDAEVRAREGLSYLWSAEEIRATLPADDAAVALEAYGLNAGPNFRDPHHPPSPDEPVRNVIRWADRPAVLAERLGMPERALIERIDRINAALLDARNRREQPATDDKVIAAWNGMTIHAMTACADLLDQPRWAASARRAFEAVWQRLVVQDGSVIRSWRAGADNPPAPGVLEDSAWLALAAASLAERVERPGDRTDLADRARQLLKAAERAFADHGSGHGLRAGVFDAPADRQDLFVRPRSAYDGAMPSGVSALIHAYEATARATDDAPTASALRDRAIGLLLAIGGSIERSPTANANSTRAILSVLRSPAAARLDALAADLPDATALTAEPHDEDLPVEVLASIDRVEIAPDKPATFDLRLVIRPEYHINAAVPVAEEGFGAGTPLIGLRVGVINGSGVKVYADYPPGEPAGVRGELRVHRGTIDLPVAVERDGEWSGRPVLTVTYQACTDTECLRPTTVELDIAIDRA